MKHAHNEGWVRKDVFAGAKVIDRELEIPCDRVLSDAEETILWYVLQERLRYATNAKEGWLRLQFSATIQNCLR